MVRFFRGSNVPDMSKPFSQEGSAISRTPIFKYASARLLKNQQDKKLSCIWCQFFCVFCTYMVSGLFFGGEVAWNSLSLRIHYRRNTKLCYSFIMNLLHDLCRESFPLTVNKLFPNTFSKNINWKNFTCAVTFPIHKAVFINRCSRFSENYLISIPKTNCSTH